jgi:hypothetical protein
MGDAPRLRRAALLVYWRCIGTLNPTRDVGPSSLLDYRVSDEWLHSSRARLHAEVRRSISLSAWVRQPSFAMMRARLAGNFATKIPPTVPPGILAARRLTADSNSLLSSVGSKSL